MKSRRVSLGPSLSAFMRSLGLAVTGGERDTIDAVREQSLRIARCNFTMQWIDRQPGMERTIVVDARIVDGLEFWRNATCQEWNGEVELSERFHTHLKQHAVLLDKRGLALLAGNHLGSISMRCSRIGCHGSSKRRNCAGRICKRRSALNSKNPAIWRSGSAMFSRRC